MLKKIKRFLQERKMIKSENEQRKINFVYWFLLKNYERALKGKVDLPAFEYAYKDMNTIRKMGKVNEAYENAMKCLRQGLKVKAGV